MAQDKYLKEHQQELEGMRQEIRDRKPEILENIDIDKMMINPREYLTNLSKEFYNSNGDKFEKAVGMSKKLSNKILKEVNEN